MIEIYYSNKARAIALAFLNMLKKDSLIKYFLIYQKLKDIRNMSLLHIVRRYKKPHAICRALLFTIIR